MRVRLDAKGEIATERVDVLVVVGAPLERTPDVDWCLYLPGGELLWADLLAYLGVFRSKSQARKAGWNQWVPGGLSEVLVGKLKHRVSVINWMERGLCQSC